MSFKSPELFNTTAIIVPTGDSRKEKYDKLGLSYIDIDRTVEANFRAVDGDEGFTKAVNTGVHFDLDSHQTETEQYGYFFLLNDDTKLFPDTISKAVEFMRAHPKCGIMGCQNLAMDNPDKIIWGGSGTPYPAGQHKIGQVSLGDLREPTKERWVTFSSAFIRREVFETIGLLDEKMVWVYSDSDFCYRARYWGWECWYNPESKILHEHNISRNPDKKRALQFRLDQAAFAAKWMNGKAYFDLDSELL